MEGSEISLSLSEQVAHLPYNPGCYMFSNDKGEVIYVGKAKHLRNRVSSYFVDNKDHTAKVRAMVRQIASLRYIVVDSETDALLLENSLIKSLQPHYNILLKDSKTYPWLVIRNEPFPRILSTRQMVKDGSQYFGPYSSISAQKAVAEFIKDILPLRTCRFNLSAENIAKGKFDTCLQYHIGNCKAPCIGAISAEEYNKYITLAKDILGGNLKPVKESLQKEMLSASAELNFEKAQYFKTRLDALEKYSAKSVIVNSSIGDLDVFSLLKVEDTAYCNYMRVKNGSIVAINTIRLAMGIESEDSALLTLGIQYIVENISQYLSSTVIVPFLPTIELFKNTQFIIPQRGDKLALLQFSERSARLFHAEYLKNLAIRNPEKHTDRLMEVMQKELRLPSQPRHIECFDNSNFQGTLPVASCVVFRNGKPAKNEYRKFKVKTVIGADDFATMHEILTRRYTRLLNEEQELPDLIVVDGGKGQLSSAYDVLCELGIENRVPIIGLAKRLEEVYYPHDPNPYYLSRTGETLKVICHIRDEAHRFGITFHRNLRSKAFIHSQLEEIEGIGNKTIETLLSRYKTISKIKKATEEELTSIIGADKAKRIKAHFL